MQFAELMPYLGIPYSRLDMDCADFLLLVQRKLFDRVVDLPAYSRSKRRFVMLADLSAQHVELTAQPKDGDVVLMYEGNEHRPGHIGMYVWIGCEAWVLHNNSLDGESVLTRLRDLHHNGLRLEGFYTWRIV